MDHFSIIHQDKTVDSKVVVLDNVTVTLQRLSEDLIGQYTKRRKALYELETSKRYSTMVNRYCCQCAQKIENDGKPGKRICPNCRSKLLFNCAECGFESKNYGRVFFHVQNKCGARISVCQSCGMECLSIAKLRGHLLTCDGTEYLRCKHCLFKTTHRAVFFEHISTHMATLDNYASQDWPNLPRLNDNAIVVGTTVADTENFMTISINNVNFGKVSGLKNNKSEYHKLISQAKIGAKQLIGRFCSKCMKPVPEKASGKNIRNNCVTCGTELRYRCLKCKRKYVCHSGIVNHVRGKCGPIPLVYGCLLCSHTSHSKYLLHRHTINCHQSGDTTKECSRCGNILKNEHSLNSHLNYCGKPPRYACDHCRYRSVYKGSIRKHLKGHLSDLFPPSSKDISDKSTNSGSSSTNQKIKYAKMIKRYCKRCKKTVNQAVCPSCEAKATLYCKKCNSEFKIYGKALYHVQDKCAARISQCQKCGIEYPSIVRLRFHLPNCGKRILGCLYCNFTTKNKTTLDNHTKRHLTDIVNDQRKDIQVIGTTTEQMNTPVIPSINNVDLSIVKKERYARLNNQTPISEEEFDTVTEGTNNLMIPSIQNVDLGAVKMEQHIRLHNQTPISEAEFEAFVTAVQIPNIKEELDLGMTESPDIEDTESMPAKEVCDDFDGQLLPKVPIKLKMDYVYMYYQEC